MKKHIFCDLDGTLLIENTYINEEDIMALKEAEKLGYNISIATGRLDYEVKAILNKYGFKGFRVSQNGGVVFDHENNLVHQIELETEDVVKIINELAKFEVLVFFQTENEYYVERKVPIITDFEKNQLYIKYNENHNIKNELENYKIVTISLWAHKDENLKIKPYLDKVLPSHLISYISSSYTIDITNVANSKGKAIEKLCSLYNISHNEVFVIGDSQNDISMFKLTPNSYVMDSARDEVKKHAKYIVSSVKDAVNRIINR